MSVDRRSEPAPGLALAEYIAALIGALGSANPAAMARMRQVVGERRARIILDDEAVDISFGPAGLRVETATSGTQVDGVGETDSATVLALLDGYLEVAQAILEGSLNVSGPPEDIVRMFVAIEIVLDASPHTLSLQALAAQFRRERHELRRRLMSQERHVAWYPFGSNARELELLARLDLLPDDSGGTISQI